ncbi:MAG: type II secretion system F family protein [bacterium]|nr:type II secretion system F family protein [bacterium]
MLFLIIFMFILTCVFLGIGIVKFRRSKVLLGRLDKFREYKNPYRVLTDSEELQRPFFDRVVKPYIERMAKHFDTKTPSSSKLEQALIMAGSPGNLSTSEFRAIQMIVSFLSLILLSLFALIAKLPLPFGVVFGVTAVGFGYGLPKFWLSKRITERKALINKTLPNVLDLLCVSVEAGLGLDMALFKVIEKIKSPISIEFKRALREITMGRPRREALKDVGKRTGVEDVESFINSIIQAEQLGVSIGNVLRIQADQMRVRYKQRVEEKARKAPLKMLFPMVFFIFPVIFIMVLGPVFIKLMTQLGTITK